MTGKVAAWRLSAALGALATFGSLGGCPASETAAPTRPEGVTCEVDADCVPATEPPCGLVPACVDERCEQRPTLLVPCP